ncbi:MAG: hypothetical protein HOQ01_11800 [Lysobacter sp.]|nr:hypothetical protein [Lysobacter sp.]
MDCTVYQTRDRLVLVPDCMRMSVLVESLFGPMTACGTIDTDSLDIALSKQYDEALGTDLYVTSSPDLVLRIARRARSIRQKASAGRTAIGGRGRRRR